MGMMSSGQRLAAMGQGGDTILAHINPQEAMMLKMMGGSGTINPKTGLPQFDVNWGAYSDWENNRLNEWELNPWSDPGYTGPAGAVAAPTGGASSPPSGPSPYYATPPDTPAPVHTPPASASPPYEPPSTVAAASMPYVPAVSEPQGGEPPPMTSPRATDDYGHIGVKAYYDDYYKKYPWMRANLDYDPDTDWNRIQWEARNGPTPNVVLPGAAYATYGGGSHDERKPPAYQTPPGGWGNITPAQGMSVAATNRGYFIVADPNDPAGTNPFSLVGVTPGTKIPVDRNGWYKIPDEHKQGVSGASGKVYKSGDYINIITARGAPAGTKLTDDYDGDELESPGDVNRFWKGMGWVAKTVSKAMSPVTEPSGGWLGALGAAVKFAAVAGGGIDPVGSDIPVDPGASVSAGGPTDPSMVSSVPSDPGSGPLDPGSSYSSSGLGTSSDPSTWALGGGNTQTGFGGLGGDPMFNVGSGLTYADPSVGAGAGGQFGGGSLGLGNLGTGLSYASPSSVPGYTSNLSPYWQNEDPLSNLGPRFGGSQSLNPYIGDDLTYAPSDPYPGSRDPFYQYGGGNLGLEPMNAGLSYATSPTAIPGYNSLLGNYFSQGDIPLGGYPGYQNQVPGNPLSWSDIKIPWGDLLKAAGKLLPSLGGLVGGGGGSGGGGGKGTGLGEGGGPKGGLLSLDEMPVPEYIKKKLKRKAMAAGKTWQEYLADATKGQKSYYGAYLA